MFDIAWGEFVVIAVVALIVIGPKELPAVLRAIGQWTTKIRRMAAEFQGQFQEALREAEMADLKKDVDNLTDTAKGFTSQFNDPMNFQDAPKWEPKTESAAESKPEPGTLADAVVKPIESPAPAAPDAPAVAEPAPAAAAAQPAIEQPATGQMAAAPAAVDTAGPPSSSPDESGPKAGEGVVHP